VRVGIEAPRQHKILRGELKVRPPALSLSKGDKPHRGVSQSQPETPSGSEPETAPLAGPVELSACAVCD
jgi:hypothetical protein